MFHHNPGIRGHSHLGPEKQRGATLIFTAAIIIALVTAMALAIDVGRLYAAQQNLQTAADIAAIEAARVVSGCATGVPANLQTAANTAVTQSIARNFANRTGSGIPTSVVNLGAAQPAPGNPGVRVFETNGNLPANLMAGQSVDSSAVQVVLTDPQSSNIFPIFPATSLSATASAQSLPQATFTVGSSLLTTNSGLLGALGINTGVFNQGSLVDADITLGALSTQLGVATPDGLLTTNLPLGGAIDAINAVSGNALGALRNSLDADLANTDVTLGDILASSGPLGQTTQINALALADALLQAALANRQTAINLPLNLDLGLASVTAQMRILEPPVLATGRPGIGPNGAPRTQATSGQLLIQLAVNLNVDLIGLASLTGTLPIFIDAGRGTAQLQDIFCANSQQNFHEVGITAQAATVQLGVGQFNDLTSLNPTLVQGGSLNLSAVGLPVLGVDVSAGPISLGSADSRPNPLVDDMGRLFEEPPAPGDDSMRSISAGLAPGNAISDLLSTLNTQVNVPILGGLLSGVIQGLINTLLGSVQGLIQPAISGVLQTLALDATLNTLLSTLGVNLGTATVTLVGVDVDQPELFQSISGSPPPATPTVVASGG